jgi:hypothetical protein
MQSNAETITQRRCIRQNEGRCRHTHTHTHIDNACTYTHTHTHTYVHTCNLTQKQLRRDGVYVKMKVDAGKLEKTPEPEIHVPAPVDPSVFKESNKDSERVIVIGSGPAGILQCLFFVLVKKKAHRDFGNLHCAMLARHAELAVRCS